MTDKPEPLTANDEHVLRHHVASGQNLIGANPEWLRTRLLQAIATIDALREENKRLHIQYEAGIAIAKAREKKFREICAERDALRAEVERKDKALIAAKEKLDKYYEDTGGRYPGGRLLSGLMDQIDAAIKEKPHGE